MSARVTARIAMGSMRLSIPAGVAVPPSRRESGLPRLVHMASYAIDLTAAIAYSVAFALLFHVPAGLEANVPAPLLAAGLVHTLSINSRRGNKLASELLTFAATLLLVQPVLGPIGQGASLVYLTSILLSRE